MAKRKIMGLVAKVDRVVRATRLFDGVMPDYIGECCDRDIACGSDVKQVRRVTRELLEATRDLNDYVSRLAREVVDQVIDTNDRL